MPSEIPLYHILNACVTFGNLYGGDAPAYGVICDRTAASSPSNTSGESLVGHSGHGAAHHKVEPTSCVVEDCVFDVGRGYHLVGKCSEDENDLLKWFHFNKKGTLSSIKLFIDLIEIGKRDITSINRISCAYFTKNQKDTKFQNLVIWN